MKYTRMRYKKIKKLEIYWTSGIFNGFERKWNVYSEENSYNTFLWFQHPLGIPNYSFFVSFLFYFYVNTSKLENIRIEIQWVPIQRIAHRHQASDNPLGCSDKFICHKYERMRHRWNFDNLKPNSVSLQFDKQHSIRDEWTEYAY